MTLFFGNTVTYTKTLLSKTTRKIVLNNIVDLLSIFKPLPVPDTSVLGKRILIFNWRDNTHKWAGGAETYIQEIAAILVEAGNTVTIFCGNDGTQKRHATVNGVRIIRRGGFYTVYAWALLYYLLRLRGSFDVVIDSENGIPFFTPLYCRKQKFLLIHHIHQEVFWKELSLPKALLASFLERHIMPFAYRRQRVITVSESSRKEIIKRFKGTFSSVDVINPGIAHGGTQRVAKSKYPLLLYVGRLKPYKNVDLAIKAFATIAKFYPTARFVIAGTGECQPKLKALARKLKLERRVRFLGRVTESKKMQLYAKAWVLLQPSMLEGWGMTVIEANACGTPVIASKVSGLIDSIIHNKTGVLVKKGSIEEFIAAITTLLANDAVRERFSENARLWSKKFSWQKSALAFMVLLHKDEAMSKKQIFAKYPAFAE